MSMVFVSGTWREEKALPYAEQGKSLGEHLARAGFDLACGPGTGMSRYVIDGFRAIDPRRGAVKYVLPGAHHMDAVGEAVEAGSDEIIQTDFDYPVRNVWQISLCSGLFILTGGDGALEEALPALIDYGIPVAVVEGAGQAATALRCLLEVFPEWDSRLIFGNSVDEIVDEFIRRVQHGRGQQGKP